MSQFPRLDELAAEDPEIVPTLVNIFTSQAPGLLEEIKKGLQQKSPIATKEAAHTLKGVSLNLGFEDLSALCQEMEKEALAENFARITDLLGQTRTRYAALEQELAAYLAA